jgi:hypothetical protein
MRNGMIFKPAKFDIIFSPLKILTIFLAHHEISYPPYLAQYFFHFFNEGSKPKQN